MRPWYLVPAVVLFALPPSAPAETGGTAAPTGAGGAEYGAPVPSKSKQRARRESRPLLATHFSATPTTLQPGGAPARFAFRIDGPARRVRVRIDIVPAGGGLPIKHIRLGWKPTQVRRVHRWAPKTGELPDGEYVARLHASDDLGRRLLRTATASGRSSLRVTAAAPVRIGSGVFPVQGADWTYGGDDARFGADRGSHSHQGQDIMAPEGTPVVSPRAGFVRWKAYQSNGAGHYIVVRGDDGRDLVFMHLRSGSIPVGRDDPVQAGMVIGEVGSTGRSDGAHLHFEIWPGGWFTEGSQPIDPRPDLDAWLAAS